MPSIEAVRRGSLSAGRWTALIVLATFAWPVFGADFVFINQDGGDEGLNDSTPTAAVGGNAGTTLGAQRLNVMVRVGEIWGQFLQSAVPIRVEVDFAGLGSSALAGAAPVSIDQNFTNAPKPNTWYPIALANSLAATDLEPGINDISVTVNSTSAFYLGFDEAPGGQNSLLDVMLHELGHGLGFVSYLNELTGTFPSELPDVYSTFVRDLGFDASWPELTSAQRVISAVSDPFLVWTGPFTSAAVPFALNEGAGSPPLELTVTSPPAVEGVLSFLPSSFGPGIPAGGLAGTLVISNDGSTAPGSASPDPGTTTDACQPLINGAAVSGNIAFIRRGGCFFDDKVYRAQLAGAALVVIANNQDTGLITPSGDNIVDDLPVTITIPSVFVTREAGDQLESASPGVTLSFAPSTDPVFTGANRGFVRLFAPNPSQAGSSVSHWSDDASPNLLMEPFINSNLDDDLDLTLTLMKDVGWNVIDIPLPHLTYETWREETFPPGATQTAPGDNPDIDDATNLEEYFFDSDPLASDSANLPVIALGQQISDITFTRTVLSSDLVWTLEKSTDLVNFAIAVEGVDYTIASRVALGTEAERITLRPVSMPADTLFFRLRISRVE